MDTLDASDAGACVTAVYQAHAVGLIRLAVIMLGDRAAAEDVVQDAFLGLYRNWGGLCDGAKAQTYVRSSVLNGCRNALRARSRRDRHDRGSDTRPGAVQAQAGAVDPPEVADTGRGGIGRAGGRHLAGSRQECLA